MAAYPDEKPMKPVMPTSKGLSYSTCSLPPSACTIGLFSVSASRISCAWAPAQPRPQNSVIRSAALSIDDSCLRSSGWGAYFWRRQRKTERGDDRALRGFAQRHVARNGDDRDPSQPDGRTNGVLQNIGQLAS